MAKKNTEKNATVVEQTAVTVAEPQNTVVAKVGNAPVVAVAPQTLGEMYDEQFVGGIESDIRYSIASRSLAQARARMKKIKGDCDALVAQIESDYSEEEAGLAVLFVESCRPELVRLYMSINYQIASTPDGQQKIAKLADGVIDSYVKRLRKDGADPLSLPATAGSDQS